MQLGLFGAGQTLPEGFKFQLEVISRADEQSLLAQIKELPFKEFEFHGYLGKRRVVSYGWKYDFANSVIREATEIPGFLLPLRDVAARFADVAPNALQQVLVTEYNGAGIGWHRDKSVFGDVIGISLHSACTFRLRRKVGAKWERVSVVAEPRSAYLMRGPSRTEWEHSIPETTGLRYSVTFRTVV